VKSPGHQKWPDHKVKESHLSGAAEVKVGGEVIAASDDVIRVDEDGSPARLYFPRSAVPAGRLEPSATTTRCPFKGTARYFNLRIGDATLGDAVWSYEDPYEEHDALKGRLAFYSENFPAMNIRTSG